MEGALRIQDIIGLILAILIVAILISIILILRENARERRRWQEEDYGDWRDKKAKRNLSFSSGEEEGVSTVFEDRIPEELEKRKGWESLPPAKRGRRDKRRKEKRESCSPAPGGSVYSSRRASYSWRTNQKRGAQTGNSGASTEENRRFGSRYQFPEASDYRRGNTFFSPYCGKCEKK